jgi:molybdopterin-guanine dinucleotide biosynthesis protein A
MSLKKHWSTGDAEIAILAGGLSERMGADKLRLRLGRRTTLGHVRALAKSLDLPTRVIHKDLVPRCGPIGGIYTALKKARKPAVLILSGDMPFVSRELVERLIDAARVRDQAVFAHSEPGFGFPALLRVESLPVVESQIANGKRSIQALARTLNARAFTPPIRLAGDLFNLNTPEDLEAARERMLER